MMPSDSSSDIKQGEKNDSIAESHITLPIKAGMEALLIAAGIPDWKELNRFEIRNKLPTELIPVFVLMEQSLDQANHVGSQILIDDTKGIDFKKLFIELRDLQVDCENRSGNLLKDELTREKARAAGSAYAHCILRLRDL